MGIKTQLNRCLNDLSLLNNDYMVSGFCFKSAQNAFICQHCYNIHFHDTPDLVLRFIQTSKAYPTVTKGCYFGSFSVKNLWNSLVVPSFDTNELLRNLVKFWDFLEEQPKNTYYHDDYNKKKELYYCESIDLAVCSGCYQGSVIHSNFESYFQEMTSSHCDSSIIEDNASINTAETSNNHTCAFQDDRTLLEFINYARLNDWDSFRNLVLNSKDTASEFQHWFQFRKLPNCLLCEYCYLKYFKFSKFRKYFSMIPNSSILTDFTCAVHEFDLHSQLKICLPSPSYKLDYFINTLHNAMEYPLCKNDELIFSFYNISPTDFKICKHCYSTKWKPILDSFPNLQIENYNDPRGVYCNFNTHSTKNDIGYRNYQITRIIKQAFYSFDNGDTISDYSHSIRDVPICDFFARGIKSKKVYLLQTNTKNSATYAYACCHYCYLTFIKHTRLESMFAEDVNSNFENDMLTNGPIQSPKLSSNAVAKGTPQIKSEDNKNKLTCLLRIHEVQQQWYLSNMTHNISFYIQICYFLRSLLNSKSLFEKRTKEASSETLGDQLTTNLPGYALLIETQNFIKSGFAATNKMQKHEIHNYQDKTGINIATSEYFDNWLSLGTAMKTAITTFEGTMV